MSDRNAMHFEALAENYTKARPPYPAPLWEDVLATGLITSGRRALDLGAGTGQVTEFLLDHGMDVVAVEPGATLAAITQERFPNATVIQTRAEDLQPATGSFDLAVIATAIHWMDLDIVLPMLHKALNANGRLLVWRNVFGDATAETTPFLREVHRIVASREPRRTGSPDDGKGTADLIVHSGLFEVAKISRYGWTIELTTEQVRALFGTFSDWTPREVAEAASIVDSLGGRVTEHYSSWLISATPREIPPAPNDVGEH